MSRAQRDLVWRKDRVILCDNFRCEILVFEERKDETLTGGEFGPLQQPSLERQSFPVPAEELGPDPVPLEELVALSERGQSLGRLDLVDIRENVRARATPRGRGTFLVCLVGQQHPHPRGTGPPTPLHDPLVFLSTAVVGVHAGLATFSSRHSSKAHINPGPLPQKTVSNRPGNVSRPLLSLSLFRSLVHYLGIHLSRGVFHGPTVSFSRWPTSSIPPPGEARP